MNPKISILIPTFNREKVLAETLNSVLTQTYNNWECIIVDDGSTDGSVEVISEFVKKDARFQFFNRPKNRKFGGCGARNFAFEKSSGEYIKWLDSDDIIEPYLLQKEVETFEENPKVEFTYCNHSIFSTEKKDITETIFEENTNYTGVDLLNYLSTSRKYILLGAYTVKKEVITQSGLWNENLKINQDGEILFRILSNVPATKPIVYSGFKYRIGGENTITSNSDLDPEKIRNKLKSWQLIDEQIKARKTNDLLPYINGYKEFLYKYYLHLQQFDSIVEFRSLFTEQIQNEKRKRIKFKLYQLMILQYLQKTINKK